MLVAHMATREPGLEALVVEQFDGLMGAFGKLAWRTVGVKITKYGRRGLLVSYMIWMNIWCVLGRMESGLGPSDTENWDWAVKVFGKSPRIQPPGFTVCFRVFLAGKLRCAHREREKTSECARITLRQYPILSVIQALCLLLEPVRITIRISLIVLDTLHLQAM
jgi:hypothetical protein